MSTTGTTSSTSGTGSAGDVVVLATVNIGAARPEVLDVDGDLRCRLDLDVPEGGTVEVSFDGTDTCVCQI